MSTDPMTELREADPAREAPPDPVSAEALLHRVLAVSPRRHRRRGLAWRLAPVAAAALALVAAAIVLLPGAEGPLIERAYATVTPSEGTIVHVATVTGFARDDGTLAKAVRKETWTAADGRTRQLTQYLDDPRSGGGEHVTTPQEQRSYHPNIGGEDGTIWVGPSRDANIIRDVDVTVIDGFRRLFREGALEGGGTVTESGRRLQRYTTTRGDDYFVDPETDELVLHRIDTGDDYPRNIETRVLLTERLPLDERTESLLEMSPHPGAEIRPFPFTPPSGRARP